MAIYYLGTTGAGETVSRQSRNSTFTHAAVRWGYKSGEKPLPSFSTSEGGARNNFAASHVKGTPCEVVTVRQVPGSEYYPAIQHRKPR